MSNLIKALLQESETNPQSHAVVMRSTGCEKAATAEPSFTFTRPQVVDLREEVKSAPLTHKLKIGLNIYFHIKSTPF